MGYGGIEGMCEVREDVFLLPLPTPTSVGDVNCYIVRGSERCALVDVGYDLPGTKERLDAALANVGVAWDDVVILATHAHSDHVGGLERVWRPGMPVLTTMRSLDEQRRRIARRFEAFEPAFRDFKKRRPGGSASSPAEVETARYAPRLDAPLSTVKDGDVVDLGSFRLEVIETPGHDFCEACFWDADRKLMFTGDHVLGSITSSVYVESFNDELGDFLLSLEKVASYPAELALPGHGQAFGNLADRALATAAHHRRRVDRTYDLVRAGSVEFIEACWALTQQPGRIPWEMRNTVGQWKCVCETAGYLGHLESVGALRGEWDGITCRFAAKPRE